MAKVMRGVKEPTDAPIEGEGTAYSVVEMTGRTA